MLGVKAVSREGLRDVSVSEGREEEMTGGSLPSLVWQVGADMLSICPSVPAGFFL